MSLDVYLELPEYRHEVLYGNKEISSEPRIFIRENGQTKQISRSEWDEQYADREPVTVPALDISMPSLAWHGNITHNLAKMADKAGLFGTLWHPKDKTKAKDLIELLKIGLAYLEKDPNTFRELNPKNGWGSYEVLVEFVKEYLRACEHFPEAEVSVSR